MSNDETKPKALTLLRAASNVFVSSFEFSHSSLIRGFEFRHSNFPHNLVILPNMSEPPDRTPVHTYFRNIFDTLESIVIGMKITLKYCFQKTVVIQYPERRLNLAPPYRD